MVTFLLTSLWLFLLYQASPVLFPISLSPSEAVYKTKENVASAATWWSQVHLTKPIFRILGAASLGIGIRALGWGTDIRSDLTLSQDHAFSSFERLQVYLAIVLLCLVSLSFSTRIWSQTVPVSASGERILLTFLGALLTGLFMLCLIFWQLQPNPSDSATQSISPWYLLLLPRLVYVGALLGLALLVTFRPPNLTSVATRDWEDELSEPISAADTLPRNQLKNMGQRLFLFFGLICPPALLVHGPRSSLVLLAMLTGLVALGTFPSPVLNPVMRSASDEVQQAAIASGEGGGDEYVHTLGQRGPIIRNRAIETIHTSSTKRLPVKDSDSNSNDSIVQERLPYAWVMFLWLLGIRIFFATGHKNEIPALHVSCPFIGFDDFRMDIAGILLVFNTMFGYIVPVLVLPLLAVFRYHTQKHLTQNQVPSRINWGLLNLGILFSARAIFSAMNVMIQRRHLMVWAVFAPKFLFDATVSIFCLPLLLVISRIVTAQVR